MIESYLHDIIASDTRFTSLARDRLYPVLLPKDPQLPAVTYQRITTRRDYTTTGAVALERIRLQFDIWARTHKQAKQLQAALVAILEDRSIYATAFADGSYIDAIMLDTATDGFAQDARLYRVSMDFIVFATE